MEDLMLAVSSFEAAIARAIVVGGDGSCGNHEAAILAGIDSAYRDF